METWNLDEALSFARGAAYTATDGWADCYATIDASIASHRQNVRDTLAEYRASQYEDEAFATFDREVRKIRAGTAYADVPPFWTVTVLCPRRKRERKHTVLFYRVARYTAEEAIEAVRENVIDEYPYKGYRIIDCGKSGSPLTVTLDLLICRQRANVSPTLKGA